MTNYKMVMEVDWGLQWEYNFERPIVPYGYAYDHAQSLLKRYDDCRAVCLFNADTGKMLGRFVIRRTEEIVDTMKEEEDQ